MKNKQMTFMADKPSELLTFLIDKLTEFKKKNIKSLLTYKQVSVAGEIITRHDFKLSPGMQVVINQNKFNNDILHGVKIIYEDTHIVVVDKPEGLLSVQAYEKNKNLTVFGIVRNYLQKKNPDSKLFIVHRLDRETSGLMMFSKSQLIQRKLRDDWYDTVDDRRYIAVVEGNVKKDSQKIITNLKEDENFVMHSTKDKSDGKRAETKYTVIKKNAKYSLLDIKLETGRKNQIRVHMKEIGHCVAGDIKYGAKQNPLNRLCLHARILAFTHPVTGKKLRFETEIPETFQKIML